MAMPTGFFDFADLDALEAEEDKAGEAVQKGDEEEREEEEEDDEVCTNNAREDSESTRGSPDSAGEDSAPLDSDTDDDNLSEVWLDDVPPKCELDQLLSRQTEEELDAEAQPNAEDQAAASQVAVTPWEVVFSRVVVRSTPNLDAAVVGIVSQHELVFEDPLDSEAAANGNAGGPQGRGGGHGLVSLARRGGEQRDPDWVKLATGRGYVLKDGRKKDPNLGILLKPFELSVQVPPHCRQGILKTMRDAWVEAQIHSNYLKPPQIRRLRAAGDNAIASAAASIRMIGGHFDIETFNSVFGREVRAMLASENEGFAQMNAPLASRAGGATSSSGGTKFWNYGGPTVLKAGDGHVNPKFVRSLLASMKRRSLPTTDDVVTIISEASMILAELPSLVHLRLPPAATLHVVGDIHGQYWDLLSIIEKHGEPSRQNQYLFNGDFVDRGQFGVEVVVALLAMKVASPDCVHLNRGNHEGARMNAIYGFREETKRKYRDEIYALFSKAFKCLPLATVVNKSVFVVHGGLTSVSGLRIERIQEINRKRDPEDQADEIMVELLWSDPMAKNGTQKSPRGGGILFGPDITQSFCKDNGLTCVIRSHEMKQAGYEWHHNKMCLTVFSAANYCGICGNSGAVVDITPRKGAPTITLSDLKVQTFEATEHPNERSGGPTGFL